MSAELASDLNPYENEIWAGEGGLVYLVLEETAPSIREVERTVLPLEPTCENEAREMTENEDFILASSDEANSLRVYLNEIGRYEYPQSPEQFSLGRGIQKAKILLYGLNNLNTDGFPDTLQEEIETTLQDKKAQFLLGHINPARRKQNRKVDEDDVVQMEAIKEKVIPLEEIAMRYGDRLNRKIAEILGIEIPEDRALELSRVINSIRDRINSGVNSYEELVVRNTKLAAKIAAKKGNERWPMEELIGEANFGLMKAAVLYDPRLGYRFSTYATWWIKQAVTRAIDEQSGLIRLPVHVAESLRGVNKKDDAISEDTRVRAINSRLVASLDMAVGRKGKDDDVLSNIIPDPNPQDFDEGVYQEQLKRNLKGALENLDDPRSKELLMLRYGWLDGKTRTLEEVGQHFGFTRERARQIESKALKQLRGANPRLKHLLY